MLPERLAQIKKQKLRGDVHTSDIAGTLLQLANIVASSQLVPPSLAPNKSLLYAVRQILLFAGMGWVTSPAQNGKPWSRPLDCGIPFQKRIFFSCLLLVSSTDFHFLIHFACFFLWSSRIRCSRRFYLILNISFQEVMIIPCRKIIIFLVLSVQLNFVSFSILCLFYVFSQSSKIRCFRRVGRKTKI